MRPTSIRRFLAAIACAALAGCTTAPPGPAPAVGLPLAGAGCVMQRVVSLPVALPRGQPLVQARIDGQPVTLLVDTGAEGSLLTTAALARLGITAEPGHTVRLLGAGGGIAGGIVRLRSFSLDGLVLHDPVIAVGPAFPREPGVPMVDGILGADVLGAFDVAFDLPHRRITLWHIGVCTGDTGDSPAGYDAIPLRRIRRSRMVLIAAIDGRAVSALLDTGAQVSVMPPETAAYLGIDMRRLGRPSAGRGLDARRLPVWRLQFHSLRVGRQITREPTIDIAAVQLPDEAMLLGDDWLGTHAVWLSYNENRLFVRKP